MVESWKMVRRKALKRQWWSGKMRWEDQRGWFSDTQWPMWLNWTVQISLFPWTYKRHNALKNLLFSHPMNNWPPFNQSIKPLFQICLHFHSQLAPSSSSTLHLLRFGTLHFLFYGFLFSCISFFFAVIRSVSFRFFSEICGLNVIVKCGFIVLVLFIWFNVMWVFCCFGSGIENGNEEANVEWHDEASCLILEEWNWGCSIYWLHCCLGRCLYVDVM